METSQSETMDSAQKTKRLIQDREQKAVAGFSVILLVAVFMNLFDCQQLSQMKTPLVQYVLIAVYSLCLLFMIWWLIRLRRYGRETQRQKENWLREHGRQIMASITRRPPLDAHIVGMDGRPRNVVHLCGRDPQTGWLYAFRVNTFIFRALKKRPDGELHSVLFDPADPAFFVIPSENGSR
jgi:hypothetical protein